MLRRHFCALPVALQAARAQTVDPRPKVRAITAFIDIAPAQVEKQIETALVFLNKARDSYRAAHFDVETIRIVTQSFPAYAQSMPRAQAVGFFQKLQKLADASQVRLNIGAAMMRDSDTPTLLPMIAEVLASTGINANLLIADDDGIHWQSIRHAAKLIADIARQSKNGAGNFNFAATAMVKPYGPFYPGSYHPGGLRAFAIGLESANVVEAVFGQHKNPADAEHALSAELGRWATDAEKVALAVAKQNAGWTYQGFDPTPAPMGGVSIGHAIELFTGHPFGSSGTMTAARIITAAVQSVPVKRIGYSGLMVPVLEDAVLARRWAERTYNMDSLLAYSAVCAGGLDTIPLPGDTSEDQIAWILGDVATLAFKWKKPLAARLLPVPGKKAGDHTAFGVSRMEDTVI